MEGNEGGNAKPKSLHKKLKENYFSSHVQYRDHSSPQSILSFFRSCSVLVKLFICQFSLINAPLFSLVSSFIYLLMTLGTPQQWKVILLTYFPNDVVSTGDIKKCLHGKPIYFEILQVPTVLLGNCRRHNSHLITVTNSLPLAKCSSSAAFRVHEQRASEN